MKSLKKWTAALLALILLLSSGIVDTVSAETAGRGAGAMYGTDPTLVDSDYDGIPDEFDTAPDSNVFTGKLKSGHDGTTSVSFTVDYRAFFDAPTLYDPDLAAFSVMGAALAYYEADYSDAWFTFDAPQTWAGGTASKVQGLELMQVLGFEDVVDYTLDSYGDDDLCEVLLGHRTVTFNGVTKVIVAIWVRGTDATSMEEWSSNFHMGDLVRFFDAYDSVATKVPHQSNDDWTRKTNHRGFDVCATRLLHYLKAYYLDDYVQPALDAAPEASLAYWLTGHSRGAAVANLMASYLIDEGAQVYAYTFAAPYNTANTEASAEKYDSIFNLVNSNDFIPMLPIPEWGFTRYGKTASVDASAYASQIKAATGEDYDGKYLTASDMSTLLGKFICITGENADRDNPGKILGWREVYVYHCGHTHEGETVGDTQSTTFVKKQSITNWGGPSESSYNGYATRLRKYSYWHDGICETPAYDLQVLVELLVAVAKGETLGGASTFITSNKLAEKFDFDKWSLISYATKLTEPHFMDTYSVIQAKINSAGNPGSLFHTLPYYTAENSADGRPAHTHTYTYVPYEDHEPTCTEEGLGYRYCLCSQADADYYDDYQKNVPIPALGHDWGEPVYAWAEDNSTVTATRICANDPDHVEAETVSTSAEITLPAACEEPGETTYTAVFTNPAFETQVRTVADVPAAGHAWGQPQWLWAEDNSAATAIFTCGSDASHVVEIAADVTETTTEPTPASAGQTIYTATVTGPDGVEYADVKEVLLAATGPQITGQPADYTGPIGDVADFTVEAQGQDLTYQWQYKSLKDGKWYNTKIAGFDTPNFRIEITVARSGMQFRCRVTDASGKTLTSDPATLTADIPALAITGQPTDYTGPIGDVARFTVEAQGQDLTYQWQYKSLKDGKWYNTKADGYNTPTLEIGVIVSRDGMQFRCKVADVRGKTAISAPATLHAGAALTITVQPEDFTGPIGSTASFTVEAQGEELTYQWQYKSLKDGKWYNTKVDGWNTPTMYIQVTAVRSGMQFRCRVADVNGKTAVSAPATLHAAADQAIIVRPAAITVLPQVK